MQAFLGSFAFIFFAKIFREICVEKYKEFNRVNFSSTGGKTKVLASFEIQQFVLRAAANKHCVIETETDTGSLFLLPNHSSNHGLKRDFHVFYR